MVLPPKPIHSKGELKELGKQLSSPPLEVELAAQHTALRHLRAVGWRSTD